MSSSFALSIPEIARKGEKSFSFSISGAWLESAMEDTDFRAPTEDAAGQLTVDAQKMGDDVLVQGRADATLFVPCARCDDPVELALNAEFAQVFVPRGSLPMVSDEEEIELTPEDIARETYVGDTIELDALIREHLILEVPMRTVCPGGCSDPAIAEYLDRPLEAKANPFAAALADLKIPSAAPQTPPPKKPGSDDPS